MVPASENPDRVPTGHVLSAATRTAGHRPPGVKGSTEPGIPPLWAPHRVGQDGKAHSGLRSPVWGPGGCPTPRCQPEARGARALGQRPRLQSRLLHPPPPPSLRSPAGCTGSAKPPPRAPWGTSRETRAGRLGAEGHASHIHFPAAAPGPAGPPGSSWMKAENPGMPATLRGLSGHALARPIGARFQNVPARCFPHNSGSLAPVGAGGNIIIHTGNFGLFLRERTRWRRQVRNRRGREGRHRHPRPPGAASNEAG